MSGSLQSPPELGVVTSQRLSVFHEIHRIWQEYQWFLIIFCSFNDFDTRWKAASKVLSLNIRDDPSVYLQTGWKISVLWLFIEQKIFRWKKNHQKKYFFGDFSQLSWNCEQKYMKSSIFTKNHSVSRVHSRKSPKKYFFEETFSSEYFLFYKQS